MVNIQSPTAEIRRGKKRKKKKEERRTNHSMKIYMGSLLHRATIKNWLRFLLVVETSTYRIAMVAPLCPLCTGVSQLKPSFEPNNYSLLKWPTSICWLIGLICLLVVIVHS